MNEWINRFPLIKWTLIDWWELSIFVLGEESEAVEQGLARQKH